jgi:organic radical activating enzyme
MTKYKIFKHLTWLITRDCNYRCPFCDVVNTKTYYSKEHYFKIIDFINTVLEDYTGSEILLFGGEPTLHPGYFDILDNLKCNEIHVFSNMSFNTDFLYKTIKYHNVIYAATFHSNFMSSEHFYNNVKVLYDNNIKVNVEFVFEYDDIDFIMEKYYPLYCKIKENLPYIYIERTVADFKRFKIDRMNKIFDKKTDKSRFKAFTQNGKHFCNSYTKRLGILCDGTVCPCKTNLNFPLYNIFKDNPIESHKRCKDIGTFLCMQNICREH